MLAHSRKKHKDCEHCDSGPRQSEVDQRHERFLESLPDFGSIQVLVNNIRDVERVPVADQNRRESEQADGDSGSECDPAFARTHAAPKRSFKEPSDDSASADQNGMDW